MLALRPIFKGEEARFETKKLPFQKHQMNCIINILGQPTSKFYILLK